ALENLYELDRGITIAAATEGALLAGALAAQPDHVRTLIESQLRAYDYVLDLVTQKRPVIEAWVRDLHVQLCSAQTHRAVTNADGTKGQRPLVHGQYKTESNHVISRSGSEHLYASVQDTPVQMQRLVQILASDDFLKLHSVDQAAYSHYALISIHP